MRRVIDGKKYDTETATLVCDVSPRSSGRSDFRYEDTQLYLTAKGAWFIAGEGGPMSRWRHDTGNGYSSGDGLRPIDNDHARELLETFGSAELVEQYFNVEDA